MICYLLDRFYYPIVAVKKKDKEEDFYPLKKQDPVLTCPPPEKNRDFYITYIDHFHRFRYSPLKPNQEYTPREASQIITLCSHVPRKPEILRKSILYVKSLPHFF